MLDIILYIMVLSYSCMFFTIVSYLTQKLLWFVLLNTGTMYYTNKYGHRFTYSNNKNDCVIVTLSSILGLEYDRIRSLLRFRGELSGLKKDTGFSGKIYKTVLTELGYKYDEVPDGKSIVVDIKGNEALIILILHNKTKDEILGHALHYLGWGYLRDTNGDILHVSGIDDKYENYEIIGLSAIKIKGKIHDKRTDNRTDNKELRSI